MSMSENGSRSAALRAHFDRHENCAPRACHGVDQNENHDLLLNRGADHPRLDARAQRARAIASVRSLARVRLGWSARAIHSACGESGAMMAWRTDTKVAPATAAG